MSYQRRSSITTAPAQRRVAPERRCDRRTGSWRAGVRDVMKLQVKVNRTGVIDDARFKTFGCGRPLPARAGTEWSRGRRSTGVEIKNSDIVAELSLPPVKVPLLGVWPRMRSASAIATYKRKQAMRRPATGTDWRGCGGQARG